MGKVCAQRWQQVALGQRFAFKVAERDTRACRVDNAEVWWDGIATVVTGLAYFYWRRLRSVKVAVCAVGKWTMDEYLLSRSIFSLKKKRTTENLINL